MQGGTSRNPPLHKTLQLITKLDQPLLSDHRHRKPRLISHGIISDSPKTTKSETNQIGELLEVSTLLSAPLLCTCAGRLLRAGLWSSAKWERGRLLHATLQIIQSEERNLSRDRTAAAIHALDRCKTVTFKTAFYSLDLEQANAGDLAAKASKARALM